MNKNILHINKFPIIKIDENNILYKNLILPIIVTNIVPFITINNKNGLTYINYIGCNYKLNMNEKTEYVLFRIIDSKHSDRPINVFINEIKNISKKYPWYNKNTNPFKLKSEEELTNFTIEKILANDGYY